MFNSVILHRSRFFGRGIGSLRFDDLMDVSMCLRWRNQYVDRICINRTNQSVLTPFRSSPKILPLGKAAESAAGKTSKNGGAGPTLIGMILVEES